MTMERNENSTRSSLLARISRSPDDPGWAEFDDLYRGFLARLCTQMGLSEEDAKDVSQEVLADLVNKLPEFSYDRKLGSFRGWLRQRVRWKVWDVSKRPSRKLAASMVKISTGIEAAPGQESSQEFDALWDREWGRHLVDKAKDVVKHRVSVRSFQVYDLLAVKEIPVKNVAAMFGITENNVYKIRHDVEEMLKDEISKLGDELGGH